MTESDTNSTVFLADDPLGTCFRDPNWLQHFPLNVHTVLDYFAMSPFYDQTCNNALCRMQRLPDSALFNMTGIEFVVMHVQEPALFVIRKQFRSSPDAVQHRATFYCVAGNIYQAPTVGQVISSRMRKSILFTQQAFRDTEAHCAFSLATGTTWDYQKADIKAGESLDEQIEKAEKSVGTRAALPYSLTQLNNRIVQLQKELPQADIPLAPSGSVLAASPMSPVSLESTPASTATPFGGTVASHVDGELSKDERKALKRAKKQKKKEKKRRRLAEEANAAGGAVTTPSMDVVSTQQQQPPPQ